MLDDAPSTAELLKGRLEVAFGEWNHASPKTNTKAELARRIHAITGRKCSPQDVNGWFKTGRMDKTWLGPVEQVLGMSLGFAAPPPPEHDLEREVMRHLHEVGIQALPITRRDPQPSLLVGEISPLYRPDLAIELRDGKFAYLEVKGTKTATPSMKELLALQDKYLPYFRVIGLTGNIKEEVRRYAFEIGDSLPDRPRPIGGLQSTMGGLDWLPEAERELLLAYRDIKLPEVQQALARPILEEAAKARRYREFFQQQIPHTDVVPDEELHHLRAPAHTPPAPKTAHHRGTKIDESKLPPGKPKPKRHSA